MTFRDTEKTRYDLLKSRLFSRDACECGHYNNIPRSFCLADGRSDENLYVGFRQDAIKYFRDRSISWHAGLPDSHGNGAGLPSNHMCCSQSACVNCLWPMTREPELLARVFRPFFPDLAEPLPIEADDPLPDGSRPFLAFEWIGTKNYLNEVGNRTRGARTTSADFAFRFRRYDGRIQLVLGEWKYTEYYATKEPKPNATQLRVYREAFDHWKEARSDFPDYVAFFVEPFYQLMRLTLFAQEAENDRRGGGGEMGADIVSVMTVVPKANRDYTEHFTSPAMTRYGRTVSTAWAQLAPAERFISITTESLLSVIEQVAPEPLHAWSDYLLTRYGWWRS